MVVPSTNWGFSTGLTYQNNSILNTACGTDEKNKNSTYNLNDTKRNLKTELLNIECLTIKTESDQE